eukprot:9467891-Pyramimonas_sp.AAC.1
MAKRTRRVITAGARRGGGGSRTRGRMGDLWARSGRVTRSTDEDEDVEDGDADSETGNDRMIRDGEVCDDANIDG